jgi:hypothetical protein
MAASLFRLAAIMQGIAKRDRRLAWGAGDDAVPATQARRL